MQESKKNVTKIGSFVKNGKKSTKSSRSLKSHTNGSVHSYLICWTCHMISLHGGVFLLGISLGVYTNLKVWFQYKLFKTLYGQMASKAGKVSIALKLTENDKKVNKVVRLAGKQSSTKCIQFNEKSQIAVSTATWFLKYLDGLLMYCPVVYWCQFLYCIWMYTSQMSSVYGLGSKFVFNKAFVLFCLLTHFSWETHEQVIDKQCRPRSDVKKCKIW